MELQLGQDVKLTLEITQSLQENTSRIRATGLAIRNRTGTTVGSCWVLGEIRLGGALAANLILNNVQGCNLIYSGSWYQGGEDSWSGYSCQEVTVPHAADGTANLTAAASLRLYTTSNRFVDSFTRSGETALPRIPRATGLSAQPGPLGEPLTLHLTRAAPGFRDTVTWQCGSQSGVLAEKTQEETLTWNPPWRWPPSRPRIPGWRWPLPAPPTPGRRRWAPENSPCPWTSPGRWCRRWR